jgi:hypothetical protein
MIAVAPAGRAFTSHWKQRMRDARPKVAGGIDGITGRSTQRKSDAPNQSRDQISAQIRYQARPCNRFGLSLRALQQNVATTPSPNKINTAVPMNSPKHFASMKNSFSRFALR